MAVPKRFDGFLALRRLPTGLQAVHYLPGFAGEPTAILVITNPGVGLWAVTNRDIRLLNLQRRPCVKRRKKAVDSVAPHGRDPV